MLLYWTNLCFIFFLCQQHYIAHWTWKKNRKKVTRTQISKRWNILLEPWSPTHTWHCKGNQLGTLGMKTFLTRCSKTNHNVLLIKNARQIQLREIAHGSINTRWMHKHQVRLVKTGETLTMVQHGVRRGMENLMIYTEIVTWALPAYWHWQEITENPTWKCRPPQDRPSA